MTYIPSNTQREYGIEDLDMLTKAQAIHNLFVNDKSIFISYITTFEDPYAVNFQTAINTADDIPSDREIVEDIGIMTEQMNDMMEDCRNLLQELYMYVKICFPDSPARMKKFGQGEDYSKAYQSYTKMRELMDKAYRSANSPEYKSQLIDKGYTQAKINNLQTKTNELDTLIGNYEEAKSDRLIITEDRIKSMNIVWNYMKTISDSSKIIFRDSPAKIQQYMLYHSAPKIPYKVQNLKYNLEMNLLTWNESENANLYVIEAMMEAPIKESNFTQRAETINNEWEITLPEGKYSFRVKGKHNGISGAFSESLDNIVVT